MKLHKDLLRINGFLVALFGIIGILTGGSVGLGAAFFIFGLLNIPVMLFNLITRNWLALKTGLLVSGVLLLIGFSICSSSTWNMH